MGFMNAVTKFTKTAGRKLAKASPAILTGMSVTSMVAAVGSAIKVTPEAKARIDNLHQQYGDQKVPPMEIVKAVGPLYGPTAGFMILSGASAIGSQSISSRRQAALEAAIGTFSATMEKYQDKVIETFGAEKESNMRQKIDADAVKDAPLDDRLILQTGYGHELCYDKFSGRYFYCDPETIRRAFNDLNRNLINYNCCSVNEFYDFLNLEHAGFGDVLGWNSDCFEVQPSFSTQMAPGNRACLVMGFLTPPKANYDVRW